jgi:oxygen-independent coproporphyrinogen-3 oxidase
MGSPRRDDTLGIYISVPFCASKCSFCNFASGVFAREKVAPYVRRLVDEIAGARARAESLRTELPPMVDSIYFGGGTPSLLSPGLFAQIAEALRTGFDISPDVEWTVECAPGQLSTETLDAMVIAGVNRISFGAQSFVDRETAAVGRLHTRQQTEDSISLVRSAGILNVNIDLLAGLPLQTPESWQESLDATFALRMPHVSVYMLEVDDDSRLGRELLSGGVRYRAAAVPTDDSIALMYEMARCQLGQSGVRQYEISNFAVTGFESRHNVRYWEREAYLGFGLDAHSCAYRGDGIGVRSSNPDQLNDYIDGGAGEIEFIDRGQQLEEAWFLGLRCNEGVSWMAMESEFGATVITEYRPLVGQLVTDGLLVADLDRVQLTDRGRLMSNEVFEQFIGERTQVVTQ